MQNSDHRGLIYGTQEQVRVRRGQQAIRIQAIEVLLYFGRRKYRSMALPYLALDGTDEKG